MVETQEEVLSITFNQDQD
jgi:WD repeat-containing protein 45